MTRKQRLLLAAGLTAACLSAPTAAQVGPSAFYLGAEAGRAHFTDICNGAAECKNRDTDGALFAGWQIARLIAAEAAATYLGHSVVSGSNVKANAVELDAVLTVPIYRRLSLLGRAGAYHGTLKSDAISVNKNGAVYGLGGQYDFDPHGALRLEWKRHRKLGGGDFGTTTNIDAINLALLFRF
jgi:hypothetical protein